MRVFKVILYFLMGIVLMAVAALGALIFVDPTAYRNQIESRARAAFGREVRIAGSIHLKRSLRPQIVVEDISIGNPEWAKGPHFVTAEKVGLQVALFPLLRGDLRVLDVFFSGVNLFLEESPDGEKNFFFGSRDGRQRTGLLPAIERLQINSSLVTYKKSDGNSRHLTIDTARLWNIPGEPERIEAQGSTKDMPFTIVLSADSAAELSSPQNPWSMQLDINAPDMSLTIAGWMDDALKWNQGEYSIKLGGDHVDSLETLFDLDLPTSGAFELSAKVNKTERSLRVTDIAALLQGTPQTPAIIISDGEASSGQDNPLHFALQGQFGEDPFTFLIESTQPLQDISQKTPWPIEAQINLADMILNIRGPDMSLPPAGRMDEASKWDQGGYLFKLSGDQADSLETLFGLDLPTSGSFELSAKVNKTERSLRVTDIAAHLQGTQPTPAIIISDGEASGGQDNPLHFALQGQFGEDPFTFLIESTQPFQDISQKTPWPIEAQINLADLKLNIESEMSPATVTDRIEFKTQVQGKTLKTLSRLLDTDLPEAGPFRLSFHTRIAEGNYAVSDLKGDIEYLDPWQKLRVDRGNASLSSNGSIQVSLDGKVENFPLSLSLKGGPGTPTKNGIKAWPLIVDASAPGTRMKGKGAVITTENKKVLKITSRISGNRFDSLGTLAGVSFPAMGKFDLRADISSDGEIHAADNLLAQIGNNRLSGSVRWEGKAQRPVLSGRLFTKSLRLSEFEVSPEPALNSRRTGLLDAPIMLDALNAFDAQLEITVKNVTDSTVPVSEISSMVTLTNGEISAPFRTNLAGVPVDGLIQMRQSNNATEISFNATGKKIDAGRTLQQMNITDMVTGTADSLELKASSKGETLRALFEQAAFTLQLKPVSLSYPFQIAGQTLDFAFSGVELRTRKGEPLTAIFEGILNGSPFSGNVSTLNLAEIQKANALLPLRVTIQKADLNFIAEGTLELPLNTDSFELHYELSGKEIQGLAPLADFALPLRGEFSSRGRVSKRGNHVTYVEDLRVGRTDLKAKIIVIRGLPRPQINANITTSQIHLDDLQLVNADEDSVTVKDRPPRVIPDYALPIDELLAADLDLDFRAERIRSSLGDLGEFVMKISLKDGLFTSSTSVTGFSGERINSEFDLNATSRPPLSRLQFNARDINFGYLLSSINVTNIIEGKVNLQIDLSGTGATRHDFFGSAEGRITIIGGPGRIHDRRIDLWAADLIPTMLSSRWRRENVTATNCLVAHIKLGEGQAKIEDLLLDTQRITIAASGILNLESETLDVIVASRPKRPSLMSLANPVRIRGTLAQPSVSVTRIPRPRQVALAGLLAGLINPAFLVLALSDTGTGWANPCNGAVERVRKLTGVD